MKSRKRRIRYSIRTAICLLLFFALIFTPWAFFSRTAALKKVDELLLRKRDKFTDALNLTYYSVAANSSRMAYWTGFHDERYRYTDPDGDTYSLESLSLSGNSYAFEVYGDEVYGFAPFYDTYGLETSETSSLNQVFIDEMKTLHLSSLDSEENLMGMVSGYRYLVTKVKIEMISFATSDVGEEREEDSLSWELYILLTEEEAPYLKDWEADMEKNALALLITLLSCTSLLFFLEEKNGVKGFFMTPKADDPKTETEAESCEENVEFMSSSAAKALLSELDQAERMTGENGYTRQIRDEISKYL